METKQINILENRAICMNKVHDFINMIVPKLQKELNKGFKLNKHSQLFKKDKERIYKIIESALPVPPGNFPVLRAYLRVNEYSMLLEVDDNYVVRKHADGQGCTVNYYKRSIYIWEIRDNKPSHFVPLERVTYGQLQDAEIDLKKLEKEKDNIEDKIRKLQRLFD